MSKQANTTLIGAFVVGAVVLAVAAIILFGSGTLFREKSLANVFFKGSVNGLRVGAPVKVRGIEIGSVKEISAIMDQDGVLYAQVVMELEEGIVREGDMTMGEFGDERMEKLITEYGLRAQLGLQSFVTGMLFVSLDYFPDEPDVRIGLDDRYLEIPPARTAMEELEENIRQGIADLTRLPLNDIFDEILSVLTRVDSLLEQPELRDALLAATSLLEVSERFVARLDSELAPMTSSFVRTADAATSSLQGAEEFITKLEDITVEDRYELLLALREMSRASRAVRVLADYLERDPSSIIHGKK